MDTPFKTMRMTESFKKWDQALKQVAVDLGMKPLRHKYNFGRISIHSGEICVAFFSDDKAFFHVGGSEIGKQWQDNGGIQLKNVDGGHRVKRNSDTPNTLNTLKQGFTAVVKNSECRNWISAPLHVADDHVQLGQLMMRCKPTAKHIRPDKIVHEADYMRNPNIYGALYDLLILAGYQNTAHIRKHTIPQVVNNMLDACVQLDHKYTNKVRKLDAKLIRRLVAIHTGTIYSLVTADTIKETNMAIASYSERKSA